MKRCRYCLISIPKTKRAICGALVCERRRKTDKQMTWYRRRAAVGKPLFRSKAKVIHRNCKFCGSYCGRFFYCSIECIRAQRRTEAKKRWANDFKAEFESRPMLICLECGSAFRPYRNRRLYCSKRCGVKAWRRGKKDRGDKKKGPAAA